MSGCTYLYWKCSYCEVEGTARVVSGITDNSYLRLKLRYSHSVSSKCQQVNGISGVTYKSVTVPRKFRNNKAKASDLTNA